jgi:uncharacterized protein (TIGR00369 family)
MTGEADPSLPTPEQVMALVRKSFGTDTNSGGSECIEVGSGHALARLQIGEHNLRPGGFISGPTQFALVDAVLWYLTFGAIGRIEPMALTSDISIRFLRPAQGDVLWARADLESAGRRNVVGSVHVWCDDRPHKPCATAQGTYVLPL